MINPLLQIMQEREVAPYSPTSPLIEETGLTRGMLGDIANDIRRCKNATLIQIEKGLGRKGFASQMQQYWLHLDYKAEQPTASTDMLVASGELYEEVA